MGVHSIPDHTKSKTHGRTFDSDQRKVAADEGRIFSCVRCAAKCSSRAVKCCARRSVARSFFFPFCAREREASVLRRRQVLRASRKLTMILQCLITNLAKFFLASGYFDFFSHGGRTYMILKSFFDVKKNLFWLFCVFMGKMASHHQLFCFKIYDVV